MSEATLEAEVDQESSEVSARLLRVLLVMVTETRPGRVGRVSLTSHLERDLGLDSLARVELLLRLGSEFGKSLPATALADAETPLDLLRLVASAGADDFAGAFADLATPAGQTDAPVHATTLVEVLDLHAARNPERMHLRLYVDDGGQC